MAKARLMSREWVKSGTEDNHKNDKGYAEKNGTYAARNSNSNSEHGVSNAQSSETHSSINDRTTDDQSNAATTED